MTAGAVVFSREKADDGQGIKETGQRAERLSAPLLLQGIR